MSKVDTPDLAEPADATRRQWFAGVAGAAIGGSALAVLRPTPALALESPFVDRSSDQTVGGVKTFTSAPVVPADAFPQAAVAGLVAGLKSKQDAIAAGTYVGPSAVVAGPSVDAVVGSVKIDGDAFSRLAIDAGGRILAGSGAEAPDIAIQVTGLSVGIGRYALNYRPAQSVAIGVQALRNNWAGKFNTAVGSAAMVQSTHGSQNTAIGAEAMVNATGSQNTAVGAHSLVGGTGGFNTAVGVAALQNLAEGEQNTAVGVQALQLLTTGQHNTAVGAGALGRATTASFCVAVGQDALQKATTAMDCTAVGEAAMVENTSGYGNNAFGHGALRDNVTGAGNCAFGAFALLGISTDGNTAYGHNALQQATTGFFLTAVGWRAGATPGSIGANATTTGTRQTLVGAMSGQASPTQRDDIVCVGYSAVADADGTVAIGSDAKALHRNSVALGKGIATTGDNQVMIGPKDIEITDTMKGLILQSPDGTRYRVSIDNGGILSGIAL